MDEFGNVSDSPEWLANPSTNPMADYIAQLWRKITPTQRTPGGLLAPQVSSPNFTGTNDFDLAMENIRPPSQTPARLAPRPQGAFLPQPAPVPIAGALQNIALDGSSDIPNYLESPYQEPEVSGGGGVVGPMPAAVPEKTLRQQYLERVAGMPKPGATGLSEEQKGRALLEASLAMMAAASKPGARTLGSLGQGGLQGTAIAREMERINQAKADKLRSEERGQVHEEFNLAGTDARLALEKQRRAEDLEERRAGRIERGEDRKEQRANDAKKIELLGEQIKQGKWKSVENGGTGTYTLIDTTGQSQPINTGVKIQPKDNEPAELKVLRGLKKDPSLIEIKKEISGNTIDLRNEGQLRTRYAEARLKATVDPMSDMSRFPSFDEFKASITGGGSVSKEAKAADIREQFRKKKISREDALKGLQQLGYQ